MPTLNNEYITTNDTVTPDDVAWGTTGIRRPKIPLTTFYLVDDNGYTLSIGIDKKFNWFQKKMIKWCFGFEVKENKNNG